MTDEAAFLAAIADAPDDDAPRLVYADWLDEHGDPRAEYVRLAVQVRGHLKAGRLDDARLLGQYMDLEVTEKLEWLARLDGTPHDLGASVQPWFWQFMEAVGPSLDRLHELLWVLSIRHLRRYREEFEAAMGEVNPAYREQFRPCLANAGLSCSEDHGDEFSAWVVMQGRALHRRVRTEPERIAEFFRMYDDYQRESVQMSRQLRRRKPVEAREADQFAYRMSRGDQQALEVYQKRFGRPL